MSEIVSIAEADQFPTGKTQFACGFYACWMAASMAKPGQHPTLSPAQIIAKAEASYAAYDGSNSISNTDGMSAEQEYELLGQIGLHFQATATDAGTIRKWIAAGYPLVVTIAETSVIDRALGRNPYPWTPAGNHVIVITGVSGSDFLVRDSANCTDLYNPNSLRPGPRTYDAGRLQISLATVVVPSWLSRPTSANPPAAQQGDDIMDINDPFASRYFKQIGTNPDRWHCATTNQDLFAGILGGWRRMNGAPRLPKGGEVKCGKTAVYQVCEGGIVVYDPEKELDNPDGPWAPCYLLHLDSPLAKQLLDSTQTTPPPVANTADAVAQLHNIEAAAATALKDLGA